MQKAVFIIHHLDEDAVAGQLAGELARAGLQVTRGAALGRTERGRQVMARHIERAGACLVLWSKLACYDPLVCGQARHAVRNAVPSLAIALGEISEPPPLGLPVERLDDDPSRLIASVQNLLAWEAAASGETALPTQAASVERPWRRASTLPKLVTVVGTVSAAVLATAGLTWSHYADDSAPFVATAAVAQRGGRSAMKAPAPTDSAKVVVAMATRESVRFDTQARQGIEMARGEAFVARSGSSVATEPNAAPTARARDVTEAAASTPAPAETHAGWLHRVALPPGRVVQTLRIGGQAHALHVHASAVRLFQLFGPGTPGLRSVDAVRAQRKSRQYIDARVSASGDTLLTVDRLIGSAERPARLRVAVWRRNQTGYWTTWRVRFRRVGATDPLTTTLTVVVQEATALVRWGRAGEAKAGATLWRVALPRRGDGAPMVHRSATVASAMQRDTRRTAPAKNSTRPEAAILGGDVLVAQYPREAVGAARSHGSWLASQRRDWRASQRPGVASKGVRTVDTLDW